MPRGRSLPYLFLEKEERRKTVKDRVEQDAEPISWGCWLGVTLNLVSPAPLPPGHCHQPLPLAELTLRAISHQSTASMTHSEWDKRLSLSSCVTSGSAHHPLCIQDETEPRGPLASSPALRGPSSMQQKLHLCPRSWSEPRSRPAALDPIGGALVIKQSSAPSRKLNGCWEDDERERGP